MYIKSPCSFVKFREFHGFGLFPVISISERSTDHFFTKIISVGITHSFHFNALLGLQKAQPQSAHFFVPNCSLSADITGPQLKIMSFSMIYGFLTLLSPLSPFSIMLKGEEVYINDVSFSSKLIVGLIYLRNRNFFSFLQLLDL